MKFTTVPTLLSKTKEGFSVAKTGFENYIQQASLNFLSKERHFMKFTTLPTLLSATKEEFSVA